MPSKADYCAFVFEMPLPDNIIFKNSPSFLKLQAGYILEVGKVPVLSTTLCYKITSS